MGGADAAGPNPRHTLMQMLNAGTLCWQCSDSARSPFDSPAGLSADASHPARVIAREPRIHSQQAPPLLALGAAEQPPRNGRFKNGRFPSPFSPSSATHTSPSPSALPATVSINRYNPNVYVASPLSLKCLVGLETGCAVCPRSCAVPVHRHSQRLDAAVWGWTNDSDTLTHRNSLPLRIVALLRHGWVRIVRRRKRLWQSCPLCGLGDRHGYS